MSFTHWTDTDLRELGLALDDRKRLLQAIARLDGQPAIDPVHPGGRTGDRFRTDHRQ